MSDSKTETKNEGIQDIFIRHKSLTRKDNIITCNSNVWCNYGFNFPIMKNKIVSFKIKPLTPINHNSIVYVCPSLATEGVINTHEYTYIGNYINGLLWHQNGYIICRRSNVCFVEYIGLKQTCEIRVKNDDEITFLVNGMESKTIKKSEIPGMQLNAKLYPAVSIYGEGSSFEFVGVSSTDIQD